MSGCTVSVIIKALNERARIAQAVQVVPCKVGQVAMVVAGL